jgi:hypothetical protein
MASLQALGDSTKGTRIHLTLLWLSWRLLVRCCLELWLGEIYLDSESTPKTQSLWRSLIFFLHMTLLLCEIQIKTRSLIWGTSPCVLRLFQVWRSTFRKQKQLWWVVCCLKKSWLTFWIVELSSLPSKYLGLPMGASFMSKAIGMGKLRKCKENWLVGRSICLKPPYAHVNFFLFFLKY